MPEVGRVLIAFDDGPLEPTPDWTRIDDTANLVADIEITAGKQTEFDRSETNRAIVRLNDTAGLADPNNVSSPWYGKLYGRQILIQLYNPVEAAWFPRFTGTIRRPVYDLNPATRNGVSILSNVALECVGKFDYLARAQQMPGLHGDVAPAGSESTVYWADDEVDIRITQILLQAGLDTSQFVVFSGNVMVISTKYDPGDPFLIALRDAADAETAVALANIYEDRFGRIVFHGRQSRIDPDGIAADAGDSAWDFQRYKIGDGAAITGDADYAQIRPPFRYSVPLERVVNRSLITPRRESEAVEFDRADVPDLVVSDAGSIATYGEWSFSYADSINGGHKTNGDTASQDLMRTSQFLVDNFKTPLIRLESVTVKAMAPSDPRADPTWNVLSRADIADVASINVGYPDGVGVEEDDFIEGFTQTITPLNPTFDWVELSLNLSPMPTDATAYDDNPS